MLFVESRIDFVLFISLHGREVVVDAVVAGVLVSSLRSFGFGLAWLFLLLVLEFLQEFLLHFIEIHVLVIGLGRGNLALHLRLGNVGAFAVETLSHA